MNFRANNLLVTGGAGFIGSNFIEYILEKYQKINVFNLDLLTYAGNLKNTSKFCDNPRYTFIQGNICDYSLLKQLFSENKIDGVINFAAESHVDNSIKSPDIFIKSNINGTYNLIRCCYENWMQSPFMFKEEYKNSRFHQISTDEIFGSIIKGSFNEDSKLNPNSPYSSSKASADLLVRSFNKTYGLNVTTSISSNNYGLNQHKEKFIPVVINSILENKEIPVYGNGSNVRDWIHVDDNCNAIDLIFNIGLSGQTYNVASGVELNNTELVKIIYNQILNNEIVSKRIDKLKIKFVNDRFGHDFRYSLNTKKIREQLNWKPNLTKFSTNIENIIIDFIQKKS